MTALIENALLRVPTKWSIAPLCPQAKQNGEKMPSIAAQFYPSYFSTIWAARR